MKRLTEQEINFIKNTGWSPTLHQMGYSEDELKRTHLYQVQNIPVSPEMMQLQFESFANQYGFNLSDLYSKCTDECDGISLAYEATYLFYTFFTKEELEHLTDKEATKWLKDFQYYFGYRKWDGGNITYVDEALEVYNGKRVFYLEDDGAVWNIKADASYIQDHPELILS